MFDKQLFQLPGIRRVLAALALLGIVQAAAIIGQALTLATALTNLWNAATIGSQAGTIALFFACFVAKQGVNTAQEALLARFADRQTSYMRFQLLEKAFKGTAGWVPAHGTAHVTTSCLEGIDQVENYLKVILPKVINAAAILPATLVVTFVLDWPSGIILVAVLPVIVFYMIMLGRMAQDRAAQQYSTYRVMSNHFIDTLRGLPTLKALGASKRHAAEVLQVSEDFREATVKTLRVATLSSVVLDLLATLGVAAVAMMLGFRLVVGQLDLFVGLAALILAPEYFAPLRQFASDFHASLDGRNALADILNLVADDSQEDHEEPPAIGTWNAHSTLSLDGVCFSYPPDAEHQDGYQALHDVSFQAHGVTRIGIVGPSGSGKSTLASLLGGFIAPSAGSICIDGVQVPLSALQSQAWQKQVLYIPQNPHLFNASLRENITFYTPTASDAEVARTVKVVGLEPLVDQLPDGLDTVVGEGGRGLSGGQAHRVALARALLDTDRRILIFDEPTAHLDIETELELKERMLPLMKGRLVFFATHRLHWLENMDCVLKLDNGNLVEAIDERGSTIAASVPAESTRKKAPSSDEQQTAAASSSSPPPPPPPPEEPDPRPKPDTWVRPYFRRYRKQLTAALGLGIATSVFAALMMLTAGYLISATAEAPGSILLFYLPIAFVQLFGIGKPLLHYLERLSSHDWVFRMTSSLRVRLYKVLETMALKPRTSSTGKILGLVADDIGHIQNLYLRTIFPLVIGWVLFALAVVALGIASPLFGLGMLVALGIPVVVAPAVAARTNRSWVAGHKERLDKLYRGLTDDMLGASDWVFAGRGKNCVTQRDFQAVTAHDVQEHINRYARWNDFIVVTMLGLVACLLLWWASGQFGGTVGGSANWIAAIVLGFFPLVDAFVPLSSAAMQANVHRDAVTHLNEFPDTDDSVDVAEAPAPVLEDPVLQLEDVTYSYPDGIHQVLRGINLDIPAGQRLAVLGPSGSGKSTLASLLRGDIAPTAGQVLLGGAPTADYGDGIAHCIGVVQQSPYLFNRPLRENLTLGCPGATDNEIWDVLERVKLADMVRRLPQQLDTLVDEAGMRFSGGERQRLALARVLLADTPIILLDEPTVGLDPAIEQDVLDTLVQATQGKTLVLITHHLQGIEAFDRVVFVEDGRIELDGAPKRLAKTSRRYRNLLAFDRA